MSQMQSHWNDQHNWIKRLIRCEGKKDVGLILVACEEKENIVSSKYSTFNTMKQDSYILVAEEITDFHNDKCLTR